MQRSKYAFCEIDLLAVALPDRDKPLLAICSTLLSAEIDIHYCYALITSEQIRPSIVVHVDNPSLAATVLAEDRFQLLDESDLRS